MPWGNVYAGQFGSDSDLARELAAAAQIYAIAKRKKPKHSPPSKIPPESPYQFVGPPEGYGLEMGSPYDPSPTQAVPEALAYAKMVGEAETKAKAAEVSVSPVTQKVLQARRASVKADRAKTLSGLAGFDPMGSGYDYATATREGLGPDETGHWPSRGPQSGQILKGMGHKTYPLTEKGEAEAGYALQTRADGRVYSAKDNLDVSPRREKEVSEQTPWQKFFTTLGDLFSGTGDESYASYENMMGGR